MSVKIYVASHQYSGTLDDPSFVTIHVGAASSLQDLGEAVQDNCGENISNKNGSFGSLTAHYWVWKNAKKTDYVGFFKQRSHLNFNVKNKRPENNLGLLEYIEADESYHDECALTSNGAAQAIKIADIILPKKWDVRNCGYANVFEYFAKNKLCIAIDFVNIVALLKKKYPSYKSFIDKVNTGHAGYFGNMFIMRWPLFLDYCDWLFSFLFELEISIGRRGITESCEGDFEFIAEWLFSVYIEKLRYSAPKLRFSETQRTFLKNAESKKFLTGTVVVSPTFHAEKNVPIILAFNDAYVPYASALLASIRASVSEHFTYDIVVLSTDINLADKVRLRNMFVGRKNIAIRFVNVAGHFKNWRLDVYGQFTKETYYRLKIPEIFIGYDKVLYLDADTVVLRDLAELFSINLDGKAVGATRDIVMSGFRQMRYRATHQSGGLEADEYLSEHLGMKHPEDYFQAGVMVFDLEQLRKSTFSFDVSETINGKSFWFLDQDILNIVLEGKVKYLDGRWNALFGNGDLENFFMRLTAKDQRAFFATLKDPSILHFAGDKKPWSRPEVSFNEFFWRFSRETPYYEELLQKSFYRGSFGLPSRPRQIMRLILEQLTYLRKKLVRR
jgi:lipopolysaccharide biosynthesis glycosyltransferase